MQSDGSSAAHFCSQTAQHGYPYVPGEGFTVTGVTSCKDSSEPTLTRLDAKKFLRAVLKKVAYAAKGATEHMHDKIRILVARPEVSLDQQHLKLIDHQVGKNRVGQGL